MLLFLLLLLFYLSGAEELKLGEMLQVVSVTLKALLPLAADHQ